MKKIILFIFCFVFINAAAAETIGVLPFHYSGPQDKDYLATQVRDAVIGGLKKRGVEILLLSESQTPEQMETKLLAKYKLQYLLGGRLGYDGNQASLLLSWKDAKGKGGLEYLNFTKLKQIQSDASQFAESLNLSVQQPVVVQHEEVPVKMTTVKTEPIQQISKAKVSEKPVTITEVKSKKEKIAESKTPVNTDPVLHDYRTMSSRLPFAVRSMTAVDLNGDGLTEYVLSSDHRIDVYQLDKSGQFIKLSEYQGGKLDYFIHVSIFKDTQPYIVVSNIRSGKANSLILSWNAQQLVPEVRGVPYLLRAVDLGERSLLLAETYQNTENIHHQLYQAQLAGKKITIQQKFDLPYEVSIFNFVFMEIGDGGEAELVMMTASGNIKVFQKQNGDYKKRWISSVRYGGSFNLIEENVRNPIGETVQKMFEVPVAMQVIHKPGADELLVADNGAFLRGAVGSGFILQNGRIQRLKWDQMGFVEIWESKRLEGGFAGYHAVVHKNKVALVAAARIRDQMFANTPSQQESVLLLYDL